MIIEILGINVSYFFSAVAAKLDKTILKHVFKLIVEKKNLFIIFQSVPPYDCILPDLINYFFISNKKPS
jgi:hypothetical protein